MRPTHATLLVSSLVFTGCATREVTLVHGSRCVDNVCLVYHLAPLDTDQDGVSDDDEVAAGSDPQDASSAPSASGIVKGIAAGRLSSFSKGFSELVVLPTKGPDGKDLLPASISVNRPSTLESLGISQESLSRHGIKQDDGFSILNAFPGVQRPGAGSNPPDKPPVFIGRFNMALYSSDADGGVPAAPDEGVDMGGPGCMGCNNPDSKTDTNKETWGQAIWKFVFGKKDSGSSSPGKPDGGTMTDPDAVPVVVLTPELFRQAWFKAKGGTVSRTVGGDIPTGPEPDTTVVGTDPNGPIMLVNPDEQDGAFPKGAKIILLPQTQFTDKRQQNTNFGPRIMDGIRPGSGKP